jgi:hypothetical protein
MRVRSSSSMGIVVVVLLVSFAGVSVTAAPSHPPSGTVSIESSQAEGSGCPAGSVAADISSDGQAITVTYSALNVEVGPAATGARARECTLNLRLNVPRGWQYALENVDFRGFAFLEPGVTGEQVTRFHIQGEAPETGTAVTLHGPAEDEYLYQTLGTGEPLRWSRCSKGKFVKLRTRLAVSNPDNPQATGMMFVTSTDAQIYHLKWQACAP